MARPYGRSIRIALAGLVTIGLAASAAMFSASYAFEPRNPQLALTLDGDNPEAIVGRIEAAIADPGTDVATDEVLEAARASIATLPLNASAFRLFAGSSNSRESIAQFEAQVAMSDRLSRRDLGTQLFLIEAAVERRDIRAALRHYDIAMRIRDSSRGLLIPVLASAIKSPEIRAELAPYIRDRAPWAGDLIRQAINTTADPRNVVRLLDEAGGMPEGTFYNALHAQLLNRLVNDGAIEAANAYYRSIGNVPRDALGSFAMTRASTNGQYAPVMWQLFEIAGIDSMIFAGEGDEYELVSELDPGFTGSIARRTAALAPGSYRLTTPVRAEDVEAGSAMRWQLNCIAGERQEPVADQSIDITSEQSVVVDFTIPARCKAQMLTIQGRIGFEPRKPVLTIGSPVLSRR